MKITNDENQPAVQVGINLIPPNNALIAFERNEQQASPSSSTKFGANKHSIMTSTNAISRGHVSKL